MKSLPDKFCDSEIKPLMCKQVQSACDVFPKIVDKVITYYDLSSRQFDDMYEKSKSNPIFRFRVQSELNRIEKL